MPIYPMRCRACGYEGEEYRSIIQGPSENCPECNADESAGFTQNWEELNAGCWVYGEDRITTVGQQAEFNEKKLGKEQASKVWENTRTKKEEACPWAAIPGTKVGKPVEGKTPWWRDGSVEGLPAKDKPVNVAKLNTQEKIDRYIMEGKS